MTTYLRGSDNFDSGVNNQTWQNVLVSRANLTNYTNSTGKRITVSVSTTNGAGNTAITPYINDVDLPGVNINVAGSTAQLAFEVPPGANYKVSIVGSFVRWWELR